MFEGGCDDIMMSTRLKKFMKTALRVGNQINDGGFSLNSLLRFESDMTFNNNATVLEYVIFLILRNDETCLLFPDDLTRVAGASLVNFESVVGEAVRLRKGLDEACSIVAKFRSEEKHASTGTMVLFLVKATQKCAIEKVCSCRDLSNISHCLPFFKSIFRSNQNLQMY